MLFDQPGVQPLGDFRARQAAAQMTADGEIILVPQPALHLIERAAFGGQVERTLYDVGAIHGGILVRPQTRTITQVSQC